MGAARIAQHGEVIHSNQELHHRKMTFQEEFRLLLAKHDISFDERYVWD
jgi:putative transposase